MDRHYFVAITLPNHIKEVLSNYKEDTNEKLPFRSWVHKEDYHITLSFLGGATEEQLKGIKNGLQTLIKTKELSFTLQGFSTFGRENQPRILWAKVSENHDLFQLQKQVHAICEENGFSLETCPYHPHITVARKWIGEEKFHLESIKEVPEISFQADTITLYESHVKETPKYKSIAEIKLQK
ncbi:RNA 2',3'-cyclic phosphodiesterase [Bacillus cereus]|uniref:RNA 2',3'-cyclic phosphodiesterase n=1 Tax=Bacillus cereus TaxID=1396 RepID=UPI002FBD39AB